MAYGQSAIVQVGVESVFGTAVPATKQIRVASESLKLDPGKKPEGVLTGGYMASRQYMMGRKITGNLTGLLVRPDEVGYWLVSSLGAEATPVLDTGATGAYKHEFSYCTNTTALPSLTVIVDRGVKVYEYAGVMVDTLSLQAASGDWLKMDVGIQGYDEQTGTLTTALTPSILRGFRLSDASTVTIGGTVMECTSVKIDLGNTLDLQQTTKSGLHYRQPQQTIRSLKLDLEVIYAAETETVRDATWIADQTAAVVISFVGDAIETGHAYTLKFNVPACQVTDLSPVVADANLMKAKITLEAIDNTTPITVDLINALATKYVA